MPKFAMHQCPGGHTTSLLATTSFRHLPRIRNTVAAAALHRPNPNQAGRRLNEMEREDPFRARLVRMEMSINELVKTQLKVQKELRNLWRYCDYVDYNLRHRRRR